MKNHLFSTLLLGLVLAFLSSCEPVQLDSETDRGAGETYIDNYRKNPFETRASILSEVSPEEQEINKGLFISAKVVHELANDPAIKQFIMERAQNSATGILRYDEVLEQFPASHQVANRIFEANDLEFQQVTSHADMLTKAIYQNERYLYTIRVINLELGNHQLFPLVSPGLETEDLEKEGLDDLIFAWYVTEGDTYEILLDEATANLEGAPLLFVMTPTPVESPVWQEGFSAANRIDYTAPEREVGKTNVTERYDQIGYRMNFRYEGNGKSELTTAASRYKDNQIHDSFMPIACYHPVNHWIEVFSASPNQMGTHLTNRVVFSDNWPVGEDDVIFNTFERDWYASQKPLGKYTFRNASGNSLGTSWIAGEMKFSNEWYLFDPTTNTTPVDWAAIDQSGTSLRFWGQKGYIDIQEVDTSSGLVGECQ